MNWGQSLVIGIGVGLLYFGGLWWTIQQAMGRPQRRAWFVLSRVIRLGLCGPIFYGLLREGVAPILVALVGFWMARWHLLRRLGGEPRVE